MREIKFRAWEEINKKMVYKVGISPGGMPIKDGYQWFDPESTALTLNIMEYVGLRDKNSKEIYGGDILSVIDPDGESEPNFEVEWDNRSSCYPFESVNGFGDFDITSIGWAREMGFKFEIIGNIYENPELADG